MRQLSARTRVTISSAFSAAHPSSQQLRSYSPLRRAQARWASPCCCWSERCARNDERGSWRLAAGGARPCDTPLNARMVVCFKWLVCIVCVAAPRSSAAQYTSTSTSRAPRCGRFRGSPPPRPRASPWSGRRRRRDRSPPRTRPAAGWRGRAARWRRRGGRTGSVRHAASDTHPRGPRRRPTRQRRTEPCHKKRAQSVCSRITPLRGCA
jgi:hypothetical protein